MDILQKALDLDESTINLTPYRKALDLYRSLIKTTAIQENEKQILELSQAIVDSAVVEEKIDNFTKLQKKVGEIHGELMKLRSYIDSQ